MVQSLITPVLIWRRRYIIARHRLLSQQYRNQQRANKARSDPMPKIQLFLALIAAFVTASAAQTTTLILQEDLSSKLPTGTAFTAKDSSGKAYKGYLVTHPARRLLRRGSMILVFTDPVVPVTEDREGVFRAGQKVRLLKLGGSLAAAKLADDAVDSAIGATKARYFAAAVSAALIILQKGGEAKLYAGDTMEVEPRHEHVHMSQGNCPSPIRSSTWGR